MAWGKPGAHLGSCLWVQIVRLNEEEYYLKQVQFVAHLSKKRKKKKRKRNCHSCKSIDHVNPTGMLRMKLGKLLVKKPKSS